MSGFVSQYKTFQGHEAQTALIDKIRQPPNVMIFAGPEGIGKKLVSRYYFAQLNQPYPKAQAALAKGDLEQWKLYAPEEGKKSFSIAQVRALIQDIQINPHPFKYRLVVIDKAEWLTFEAASALLKSLEDPPYDWTRFVLLVSSADTLLATIRSRSHLLQFYPLAISTVEEVLRHRKMDHADELAKISGGSVGRAIELALDQNKQIRTAVIRYMTAGTQLVVYSAFQFVDGLKSDDYPVVNQVLDTLVCDLISAKLTGQVRFNHDFAAEIQKRATQTPKALELLVQEITEYLGYADLGLNMKLQLKSLLLAGLFNAKGVVI